MARNKYLIIAAFALVLAVWAFNNRYEYTIAKAGNFDITYKHDKWTGKTWEKLPFYDWKLVENMKSSKPRPDNMKSSTPLPKFEPIAGPVGYINDNGTVICSECIDSETPALIFEERTKKYGNPIERYYNIQELQKGDLLFVCGKCARSFEGHLLQ